MQKTSQKPAHIKLNRNNNANKIYRVGGREKSRTNHHTDAAILPTAERGKNQNKSGRNALW